MLYLKMGPPEWCVVLVRIIVETHMVTQDSERRQEPLRRDRGAVAEAQRLQAEGSMVLLGTCNLTESMAPAML